MLIFYVFLYRNNVEYQQIVNYLIKMYYRYKIAIMLLCSLVLAMQSCKQSTQKEILTERQIELKNERNHAGLRLQEILEERDFERALLYVDSLNRVYPNDPQLYFTEGWVYDMQGDGLRARASYTKSISIYDSLITDKPHFDNMINRAVIVQILYGMEAYNRALDEIQSTFRTAKDSLNIKMWKEVGVIKKDDLFIKFPQKDK